MAGRPIHVELTFSGARPIVKVEREGNSNVNLLTLSDDLVVNKDSCFRG